MLILALARHLGAALPWKSGDEQARCRPTAENAHEQLFSKCRSSARGTPTTRRSRRKGFVEELAWLPAL